MLVHASRAADTEVSVYHSASALMTVAAAEPQHPSMQVTDWLDNSCAGLPSWTRRTAC